MDAQNAKIIALFTLFVSSLIAGLLPLLCLRRRTWRLRDVLNFCNCFAGGVFLGTFLLHLLPESQEEISKAFDADFPICEVIVAGGFFLILFIECSALACYHDNGESCRDERRPILGDDDVVGDEDTDGHEHSITSGSSTLRSFVFLLALSIHSLFEGVAVGIQKSSSDTFTLLLAIAIHKCVLSFSFSLNLARQNMTLFMQVTFLVVFSLSSPLGVAIAIAVSAETTDDSVNGVLQSLASGTFMYIIFIEIVPTLHLHKHRGPLKALVMLVGFGVMVGLQFVHDH